MSTISANESELRDLVCRACHALSAKGLVAATDGNVSARLSDGTVLVTPSNVAKGLLRPADILVVDMDGQKQSGSGAVSSEVKVHLSAYRARPEIGGVVHAHPPLATAFTFAGKEHLFVEPIVPEVVAQIGPIPCVPYVTPGTQVLAETVGGALKECDLVLMRQHGAVAVAADPWAAYLRMEKLEYLAQILREALLLNNGDERALRRLDAGQVEALRRIYRKA